MNAFRSAALHKRTLYFCILYTVRRHYHDHGNSSGATISFIIYFLLLLLLKQQAAQSVSQSSRVGPFPFQVVP